MHGKPFHRLFLFPLQSCCLFHPAIAGAEDTGNGLWISLPEMKYTTGELAEWIMPLVSSPAAMVGMRRSAWFQCHQIRETISPSLLRAHCWFSLLAECHRIPPHFAGVKLHPKDRICQRFVPVHFLMLMQRSRRTFFPFLIWTWPLYYFFILRTSVP